MRAGDVPGRADAADHLADADPAGRRDPRQVAIPGLRPVRGTEDDAVPVGSGPARRYDPARCDRADAGPGRRCEVEPGMHARPEAAPLTEARRQVVAADRERVAPPDPLDPCLPGALPCESRLTP